jgi:hypothetical protein
VRRFENRERPLPRHSTPAVVQIGHQNAEGALPQARIDQGRLAIALGDRLRRVRRRNRSPRHSPVKVKVLCDATGRVVAILAREGHPALLLSASAAALEWAYAPALVDGLPAPMFMTVTVNFRLK